MLSKSKINPKLLLAPITLQEAIQTTRIQGTQVTLDDMLEYKVVKNIAITIDGVLISPSRVLTLAIKCT